MPTTDLIRLTTLTNADEAEQVKLRLHAEGIFCFLEGIHQGGLSGVLPIHVMVRPADLDRARVLIEPRNA